MRLSISICLCALALVACKKNETAPVAATPPAAPTASAPSPDTQAGHRKMANCPSTVAGASTSVAPIADGVEVTVTAKDEPAIKEIRERATHLAGISVKNPTEVKHNGEGEGGGSLGSGPIVLSDTTITSAEVEGGAKVTVKPGKPENLDWLKKEAESRSAKLASAAKQP